MPLHGEPQATVVIPTLSPVLICSAAARHGGWKDWNIGLRYPWLAAPILLTPYRKYGFPSHDDPYYGESALGMWQTELQFGLAAGYRFPRPLQNLYITGDASFYSKQGGLTGYQFDPTEKFVNYYAHLDRYAPGLVEGKPLHRSDPIGLIGFSGNANPTAPHLHFAISVLGPEKHW